VADDGHDAEAQVLEIGRRSSSARQSAVDSRGLGVVHLLVLIDVLAWCLATVVVGVPGIGASVVLVLVLWLNAVGGLYQPKLSLSALDEAASLTGRALVAGAMVTSVRLVAGEGVGQRLLHLAMLLAALAVVGRALGYALVRRLRRAGLVAHPTLVVGAGRVGGWVAEVLCEHPEYGLRPVGFLDSDPLLGDDERELPVLGDTTQLATVLKDHGVRSVVVAFAADRESGIVDILRTCDRYACEIFYVPRLYEMQERGRDLDHIWSLPLSRLRRAPFRSWTWGLKRLFDIVASVVALAFLAPALLACSAAVRWQIGSPVLFRQLRVGLDGREFELLKFRTLTPVDEAESQTNWNVAAVVRLTPVGRFLRSTSMDELPQLLNILRGDMSVVGPRPERPFFVRQFTERFPRYMARHRVPAGLTGWAQVHGLRGDTSIADRARFDNYYIENWSLWQDVKIILRTVAQVARRAGG
jgi:exopolysaccharide biosynthesis polyprenyl glycosylphosphotransferase